MKKNYPYLNDIKFLQEMINNINIVYYVKISILTWQEDLIKQISGKVTSFPSINIDGKSAVRRTASIAFCVEEQDADSAALLELNKKVYLEIGQVNHGNKYTSFPIVWFPIGMFVITNLSFSHNLSNISISMSLKDKMCLLNGQCGGTIPAATVFDNYEVQEPNGDVSIVYPTLYQIIMELVNHFGGEQIGNIIISDLDTKIKQVMEWTGDVPLFVLRGGDQGGYFLTTDEVDARSKESIGYQEVIGSPFEAGSSVGFILTDFSYPGDLIGNAGDTVVTILDKIKNLLGNFEYFYDIEGHFRFQQMKNYLNNSQSKYILESLKQAQKQLVPEYLTSIGQFPYLIQKTNGKAVFSFKDNKHLVTSYANTPQLQNIKNDYIVWGLRKTVDGNEYPIRYHLVIDKKPKIGNQYEVIKYVDTYDNTLEKWYKPVKYNNFQSFPVKGLQGVIYYDNSESKAYIWKVKDGLSQYVLIDANLQTIKTKDWRTELYFQGVVAEPTGVDSNFYYAELMAEWPKIYDIKKGEFKEEVLKDCSRMDYYLDFIDPVSDNIKKISVNNIGHRIEILNKNNDVNCVFEPYIPDVILIELNFSNPTETDMGLLRTECIDRGLDYSQVSEDIYNLLIPGRTMNSGYQQVKQSLNQYINYSENITLQTLPIYFLEPNTCIQVEDKDTQISGNYMINSLNYSADSLSINASKIISRNL